MTPRSHPGVRTDDGVLLHTEVEDVGSSPVTVVLVHGFAARHEEFTQQRDALRSRARLVLFDQRGHEPWAATPSGGPGCSTHQHTATHADA